MLKDSVLLSLRVDACKEDTIIDLFINSNLKKSQEGTLIFGSISTEVLSHRNK